MISDNRTATSCIRVKSTKEVVKLGEVKPFLAEITAISPYYVEGSVQRSAVAENRLKSWVDER